MYKFITLFIISMSLSIVSLQAVAGKLYRYKDDNGRISIATSLPASAAQKGYDVLDANTMRVIEHVRPAPTAEEIAEMERQSALEEEKRRQAEIEAKAAEDARKEQAIYDRTLLTTYESEIDLITARDKHINYRKAQITTHESKLPELRDHQLALQKEAAGIELKGKKISSNMQKRLDAAQKEIEIREQAIATAKQEISTLEQSYAKDLARLKELLSPSE